MPNHKSVEKRVRQTQKRRIRNRQINATTRTWIKKVRSALEKGDAALAQESLSKAVKALDQSVTKGVMHRSQASRKISRLTKAVNQLN